MDLVWNNIQQLCQNASWTAKITKWQRHVAAMMCPWNLWEPTVVSITFQTSSEMKCTPGEANYFWFKNKLCHFHFSHFKHMQHSTEVFLYPCSARSGTYQNSDQKVYRSHGPFIAFWSVHLFLFSELLTRTNDDCETPCLMPCRRSRYDPSLSYSQLSKFNVERLVVKDNESRESLKVGKEEPVQLLELYVLCADMKFADSMFFFSQRKFLNAMEIQQRIVKHIANQDKTQMSNLLLKGFSFMDKMISFLSMTSDSSNFASEVRTVDLLSPEIMTVRSKENKLFWKTKYFV